MDQIKILNEETGNITERVDLDNPRTGCLGQLKGPIAEWGNPTRNGRFYSKQLWENVFNTSWVKEALDTHTLFGEVDHPTDRIEPKLTEAAVSMTDYSFSDGDKTLYGTFDILNTPKGRILKALADYGCKLGVSSRGRGSLTKRGNTEYVDEKTYIFGGFDIVALPAVKKARETYVSEDYKLKSALEVFKREINSCKSSDSLESIKNVFESVDFDDSGELNEMIEQKEKSLGSYDNTIIEGLRKDLKSAYSQINNLESQINNGNNAKSINTIDEDYSNTIELLDQLSKENLSYSDVLEEYKKSNKKLKNRISELEKESKTKRVKEVVKKKNSKEKEKTDNEIEELQDEINFLKQKNSDIQDELDNAKNKLQDAKDNSDAEGNKAKEINDKLNSKIDDLENKIKESDEEFNSLVDDYNELIEESNDLLDSYVSQKSKLLGLSKNGLLNMLPESFTKYDVDDLVKAQQSERKRLNAIPINVNESLNNPTIVHSANNTNNSDFTDTVQILKNMK